MTTREQAETQGRTAASDIKGYPEGGFAKFHNQLEALQKDDEKAGKTSQHLKECELAAANKELVDGGVLPKVDIDNGHGGKTSKYEVVGTTAVTDVSKKNLVVAVGRNPDGTAKQVVILGQDGKYHEAEAVKGDHGTIKGYKAKQGGWTCDVNALDKKLQETAPATANEHPASPQANTPSEAKSDKPGNPKPSDKQPGAPNDAAASSANLTSHKNTDGSTVYTDKQGRIGRVDIANTVNGLNLKVTYLGNDKSPNTVSLSDGNGKSLMTFTRNGDKYDVTDATGAKVNQVKNLDLTDGNLSYDSMDGKLSYQYMRDGSTFKGSHQADGSTLWTDSKGRLTEIDRPNKTAVACDYTGDETTPSKITEFDSSNKVVRTFTRDKDKFTVTDSDGKKVDVVKNVSLTNGVLSYESLDGNTSHRINTDGTALNTSSRADGTREVTDEKGRVREVDRANKTKILYEYTGSDSTPDKIVEVDAQSKPARTFTKVGNNWKITNANSSTEVVKDLTFLDGGFTYKNLDGTFSTTCLSNGALINRDLAHSCRITSTTDANGGSIKVAYDSTSGDIASFTLPDGSNWEWSGSAFKLTNPNPQRMREFPDSFSKADFDNAGNFILTDFLNGKKLTFRLA